MCCRCWRCCMPPSISPCFSSFFPPTPSIQPPLWAHTLFQPPSSIQTEIQPHQTSVLMSEGHKGIYFYSSLEPLPPEHLTWFHTSSHLQSPTETQSSCLSSIIQTNVMSDYLPPFICIQFLPRTLRASIYVRHWNSLFMVYSMFEMHWHSQTSDWKLWVRILKFQICSDLLPLCKCHENKILRMVFVVRYRTR